MSKKPLVSIITPAFNCSDTFEDTFNSVVNQSFLDWEWIIVEDCSKDNSFEVISGLIKDDKRISLLKTNENSGAAKARNIGIEKASGKFIAFIDADDIWLPNKLESQLQYMMENNITFSYTNYDVLLSNGKVKIFNPKKKETDYKYLLKRCDIGCSTVIYDSESIGKHLMPLDCKKREDYATWLDIMRKGVIAKKYDVVLSRYRIREGSASSNKLDILKHHYYVYRKHEHFGVIKSIYYIFVFAINRFFNKY